MILASSPSVGGGFPFGHGRFGLTGAFHALDGTLTRHACTTDAPLIILWMKIEAFKERQTRILKPSFNSRRLGALMFGRKKKDANATGVACPYCEYNNPLGAETCEQCYYSLNKSAREQPMAEPTTSGEEIMSLLLAENEEEEDTGPVVEAVLEIDDVTVEVDQYAAPSEQTENGETVPETFDFIGSEGPTLSATVETSEPEEVELTAADAPKEYVEFDLGSVDPLAEVAEPVHTGKGGLYSPTVEVPKDDDLLGEVGPAPSATPDLPDLPDDADPTGANLAQAMATETAALPGLPEEQAVEPATPSLPDLPEDEPVADPATQAEAAPQTDEEVDDRIWPWPKAEPWSATQVYQEVVAAMEHVKHGRMEAAATTLDTLGPHLDDNLDMLLHISVLLQHLGRNDHMKWTLDMAAYVHPNDAHVLQARSRLLA